MRSLTPVQAAAAFAVFATTLFVGIPAFFRDLQLSRLAEAMDGLGSIAAAAASGAEGQQVSEAYPDSVGWTPEQTPSGQSALDPPEAWNQPTWQALGFGFEHAHFYSFSFEAKETGEVAEFQAHAQGDLDGDGQLSHFSIGGEYHGEQPLTFHLEMRREIE